MRPLPLLLTVLSVFIVMAEPAIAPHVDHDIAAEGLAVLDRQLAGEGHGFRQAATVIRTLEAELYFYGQVFGFRPADDIEAIQAAAKVATKVIDVVIPDPPAAAQTTEAPTRRSSRRSAEPEKAPEEAPAPRRIRLSIDSTLTTEP